MMESLKCRSLHFHCLLLVFIRQWGWQLTHYHLYHEVLLWLGDFYCDWGILIPIVPMSTGIPNSSPSREHVRQFKSTAVLPYVKGVSGPIYCCLQQDIDAVFKSDTTLGLHLQCISWRIAAFIWLFCKQSWLHFLLLFHHSLSVFL